VTQASPLVLSLFPGIGLLDMAFELEGFCVVRGPDLLWGGDIRRFHPPPGKFEGVIGGPPCQSFSSLARLNIAQGYKIKHGNLIPEFERVVAEARPDWFIMENVTNAPLPAVADYITVPRLVRDITVGGLTQRVRRITFGNNLRLNARGMSGPFVVEELALHPIEAERAVTGDARVATVGQRVRSKEKGGGTLPNTGCLAPFAQMLEHQGLPADFLHDAPFTGRAMRQMVGNGVPLPMGRAVARAVRRAMYPDSERVA
jgi:DNA (cytosine-5)-methyltransferase 1